jgi:DNA-binding GntR family transcriptional regulator
VADDRISRTLLREQVLGEISRAILDGTLRPGERLRDDELTAWLGTSRAPIREALDQLADIGLVEMAPNRFTKVAVVSPRLYAESMAVWAALVTRGMLWGILAFPEGRLAELERVGRLMLDFDSRDFPDGPTPVDHFVGIILEHCDNRVLLESISVHGPLLQLGVNRYKGIVDSEPVFLFLMDIVRRCREHDVDGFEADIREFLAGPMREFTATMTGFDAVSMIEEARVAHPPR